MLSYSTLLSFIQNNKDNWKTLLEASPYFLSVTQCPFKDKNGTLIYPELYMLSYDITRSTMFDPLVRVCRGCIVSVEDINNPKMVCTPFYKFFNYGEKECDSIDWETSVVLEKVDGSLIKLFNYKNNWIWITNNGWNIDSDLIDALPCKYQETDTDNLKTYEDLKNYALNKLLSTKELRDEFDELDKEYTYMFELISPKNRIICEYEKTELVFLGVRNINTWQEVSAFEFTKRLPILSLFRRPQIFNLRNIDDILALCNSYKDTANEGVVVCDKNFNRFKIKCQHYLSIKYTKKSFKFSSQHILEAYLNGTIDDALANFKELNIKLDIIKENYLCFRNLAFSAFKCGLEKYKKLTDEITDKKVLQKTFYEWALNTFSDGKNSNKKVQFVLLAKDNNEDRVIQVVNRTKYAQMLEYIGENKKCI